MRYAASVALVMLILVAPPCLTAGLADKARTGSFRLEFTPAELLGNETDQQAAEILHSDDPLSWQIHVADTRSSVTSLAARDAGAPRHPISKSSACRRCHRGIPHFLVIKTSRIVD